MTKTIEITVDSKGQTKVETKGFTGASCQEASRFVEVALGARSKESLKAEFHHGSAQSEAAEHQRHRSQN